MNKFLVMVILKPDIKEKRINKVQNSILNLFEQNTKVKKVWYLGKSRLDYKNKNYSEGVYLKLDITAKPKKIESIRQELRNNQDILSCIIMNNDSEKQNKLPKLKMKRLSFYNNMQMSNTEIHKNEKKVYVLINQNTKSPFAKSNVIAISDNEDKIIQFASKKVQEYLYIRDYQTLKKFNNIKDIENELKRIKKIQLIFDNNPNIMKDLVIQEKYLI